MNPLGVVDGDADGYQNPSDCPIPLDRTGSSRSAVEEEVVVNTDDEDEFLVGRCMPCPGEPSPELVARHNLTSSVPIVVSTLCGSPSEQSGTS